MPPGFKVATWILTPVAVLILVVVIIADYTPVDQQVKHVSTGHMRMCPDYHDVSVWYDSGAFNLHMEELRFQQECDREYYARINKLSPGESESLPMEMELDGCYAGEGPEVNCPWLQEESPGS